jgi:hypothetical protein
MMMKVLGFCMWRFLSASFNAIMPSLCGIDVQSAATSMVTNIVFVGMVV